MPETCVSDTGPILHLAEIGHVSYLKCLGVIYIPVQVRNELRQNSVFEVVCRVLDSCMTVVQVAASEIEVQRNLLQGANLHTADLSVAVLADRLKPDVVLTDDLQLRKTLEMHGPKAVGSVGILVRAFACHIIEKVELDSAVDGLLNGSSLYTSRAFRVHVHQLLDSLK